MMEDDDGKWPPLVPPIRSFQVFIPSRDPPLSLGAYKTLIEAQVAVEKYVRDHHDQDE
jgi:hypothetical protein